MSRKTWDVLVIGGGLAGLCAAIAARRRGAGVRLIESAPLALRGGHARHARNFRIPHATPTWHTPGVYTAEAFLAELIKISCSGIDSALAASLIDEASGLADWLIGCGVRLQDPRTGKIPFSRRTAFLLGGGKAMINALYQTAESLGVVISYDAEATALGQSEEGGWQAALSLAGGRESLTARAVIAAAGGPGGDPAWLSAVFGPAGDHVMIRGGAYSDGRLMQILVNLGAETVGDPTSCHRVAVDARGPKFDGGIVTRITAIPFGFVVDKNAERVTVSTALAGPAHYAQWGPRIAACADGVAYLLLDADGLQRADVSALPPLVAPTLDALADALGLDRTALARTLADSGSAPPFAAYPLRAGLTFVHHGLRVDADMRVHMGERGPADDLFAAGMIMAANVLARGYLAGFGITLCALSGRRAGEAAARHVGH